MLQLKKLQFPSYQHNKNDLFMSCLHFGDCQTNRRFVTKYIQNVSKYGIGNVIVSGAT